MTDEEYEIFKNRFREELKDEYDRIESMKDKSPRQKKWLVLRAISRAGLHGEITGKTYTKEELLEKRKYFESLELDPECPISKARYLYEVKRIFERSKTMDTCPDSRFARLEFVRIFGL